MILDRINNLPWHEIDTNLDKFGFSTFPALLSQNECADLINLYPIDEQYRNVINMQRYRFGEGEYKYFSHPLPELISKLREAFYPNLASIANEWMNRLGKEPVYPTDLPSFLAMCHAADQSKPTPLILRYEEGGFNCLHQDLYGDVYFPFQVLIMLSSEEDYSGGEFLLVEQIPRAQSRGHVITLKQGQGVIFPTQYRPTLGKRGYYRTVLKHGVGTLKSGVRYSLGVIFHDAK